MQETSYERMNRLWEEAHTKLSQDGFDFWLCSVFGAMEAIIDNVPKRLAEIALNIIARDIDEKVKRYPSEKA